MAVSLPCATKLGPFCLERRCSVVVRRGSGGCLGLVVPSSLGLKSRWVRRGACKCGRGLWRAQVAQKACVADGEASECGGRGLIVAHLDASLILLSVNGLAASTLSWLPCLPLPHTHQQPSAYLSDLVDPRSVIISILRQNSPGQIRAPYLFPPTPSPHSTPSEFNALPKSQVQLRTHCHPPLILFS